MELGLRITPCSSLLSPPPPLEWMSSTDEALWNIVNYTRGIREAKMRLAVSPRQAAAGRQLTHAHRLGIMHERRPFSSENHVQRQHDGLLLNRIASSWLVDRSTTTWTPSKACLRMCQGLPQSRE